MESSDYREFRTVIAPRPVPVSYSASRPLAVSTYTSTRMGNQFRRKLLWITGFTTVSFGLAFIDGLMMQRDPTRGSFLNFRVDDVHALVWTAGPTALIALIGFVLILKFWRKAGPGKVEPRS